MRPKVFYVSAKTYWFISISVFVFELLFIAGVDAFLASLFKEQSPHSVEVIVLMAIALTFIIVYPQFKIKEKE